MKGKIHAVLAESLVITFALFAEVFSPIASAQILPTSLGEVKEAKRTASTIARAPSGSGSASKVTNSVLFVLTEPPDAEVAINGKPAGKAIDGEFRKELPAGGRYSIIVSAGPNYEPFKKTVVPKSRRDEVVRAALVSKYGLVRIGPILDGATVFIDDELAPANSVQLDKESNTVRIDNLRPGDHKISYQHPDYVPLERRFKVSPSVEYLWTYNPEPATVELTIQSDPDTALYVDGEPKGRTTGDGVLRRSDIRIGQHEIKLVKDDFEEYLARLLFEFRKKVRVEHRLVPLPTSAEFSDDFDLPKPDLWTMPASGMTFKSRKLDLENAKAVGFPTNVRYRDFEMNFHLQLTNSGGAAWAVRVKDSSNYYLFYLSGPDGLFRNRFNTYIVRNNEFDPSKPARSDNVIARLVAGGQYDIHIKAAGSRIEHTITPAETGKAENLGFFDDPNSTFRLGGIGFRTISIEKFSVDELVVRPR
jgi:PEGA domain-containing protein